MIKTKNLKKTYATEDVETTALSNVNLEIKEGEFVSIMGPSGCGKSTLLNIMGLLDNPTSGEYWFLDTEISNLSERQRAQLRKGNIGFVFQSFNLIPDLNVFDNVDVPLRYQGLASRTRRARIETALTLVGLFSRARHLPSQLSGGQQQRVAIARALACQPRLILADEPTGNLDSATAREIMELLEKVNASGTTIVMVTHDIGCAASADRQIHLLDGRLIDLQQEPPTPLQVSQLGLETAAG